MAFLDLLPAILGGAATLFGGGGGGTDLERITATAPNIPGGQNLEGIGAWRSTATAPYTTLPNRAIDFGQGLYSSGMQVPQFVPNQGQSTFNPGYGGGYTAGTTSSYTGSGANPNSIANSVNPIYGNASSGSSLGGFLRALMGGYSPQQGQTQQAQQGGSQQGTSAPLIRQDPGSNYTQGGMVNNPGSSSTVTPGSTHPLEGKTPSANGLLAPPGAPSSVYQENFTPSIFRDSFVSGINAANQIGSYAAQAVPGAANYQASLYDPNLNAMEQSFLTAGANLGLRGLESSFNQINSQYENTPFHSSRGVQMDEAANQFSNQMMGTAGNMGTQRQQMATNNLQQAFSTPLSSNQFGQQSAAGLYNLFSNAMTGELAFPTTMYQSYPVQADRYIQTTR